MTGRRDVQRKRRNARRRRVRAYWISHLVRGLRLGYVTIVVTPLHYVGKAWAD